MSRIVLVLVVTLLVVSPGISSAQESDPATWVSAIDWSPDGTKLAVAFRTNEIWLYTTDLEPIAQLQLDAEQDVSQFAWSPDDYPTTQLPHDTEQNISQLAWSPDGNRLAASTWGPGRDDRIYIWDVESQIPSIIFQQNQAVSARISWSPDSSYLATTEFEHINIWDVNDGNYVTTLLGHKLPGSAWDVAWHPDGVRLVSGGGDYVVRIWDTSTGEMIKVLSIPEKDCFYTVRWSSDGSALAAHADIDVYVWSAADYQQIIVLTAADDAIAIMDMNWRGDRLAASSADSRIRIWESNTWGLVQTITLEPNVSKAFSLSPDGSLIAHSNLGGVLEITPVQ